MNFRDIDFVRIQLASLIMRSRTQSRRQSKPQRPCREPPSTAPPRSDVKQSAALSGARCHTFFCTGLASPDPSSRLFHDNVAPGHFGSQYLQQRFFLFRPWLVQCQLPHLRQGNKLVNQCLRYGNANEREAGKGRAAPPIYPATTHQSCVLISQSSSVDEGHEGVPD